jgi:hypothetical protein
MLAVSRMTVVFMSLAAGFNACEPQTGEPAMKVHAYEREVIGGIPGGGPGGSPTSPRPIRYLVYLETPRDTKVAVEGIWVKGTFYSVETATKQAPVKFDSPVVLADESRNYAVPPTANAVTEIVAKTPVAGKLPDSNTNNTLRGNEGVLELTYAGKTTLIPIKTFERRDPIYLR